MFIDNFIFSIITFISPFIIIRYFKLNNYKGYVSGLLCFLSFLGILIGEAIVFYILLFILLIFNPSFGTIVVFIFILVILLFIAAIIFNYNFHFVFIKQILEENKNSVIFMYISGFCLINGIFNFFYSFQEKRIDIGDVLSYNTREIINPFVNYLGYVYVIANFGICVCIFFHLKQTNKNLLYVSLGIYLGIIIVPIIAIIFHSIIIFCMIFLISLFSLIIGIYLYIKYEKEDNSDVITEVGNINYGNLDNEK